MTAPLGGRAFLSELRQMRVVAITEATLATGARDWEFADPRLKEAFEIGYAGGRLAMLDEVLKIARVGPPFTMLNEME